MPGRCCRAYIVLVIDSSQPAGVFVQIRLEAVKAACGTF